MKIQSLNGTWNYRIGHGKETTKSVPFSALPVGHSECSRYFDLDEKADKITLKFDSITYSGKVTLNGHFLGDMLPYCEYSFDVTDLVHNKGNFLLVELEDISPKFGPTEGWENFGGIIRDVSLIYNNEYYIRDVFFHSSICDNYTNAEFVVETKASKNDDAEFEIKLFHEDTEVASYIQPAGDEYTTYKLENVRLWSPKTPDLYKLQVRLLHDGEETDCYMCNVGFREFKCDRHRFLLNGEHLYLVGVCKHEMFGDSGHCPSEEQMERDLRMIKETGSNFVRLVHYPHNKKILELADKIGLMVSEEPGLWWSDTSDPEVSAGSLEVLRRTILRDRNHASIVFWLCFNECKFTEQFLIDSANVCRKFDPTRMVSGANCMSNEDTKIYYNKCNFDFYTMHPYSATIERSIESAKYLYDKPLLFTEWGGYFVYNNPNLFCEFMDEMYKMYLANSDEGALAGSFFWCWAEVNDFNRGEPACIDGNLCEGLVSQERKPLLIYDAFCKSIAKMNKSDEPEFWYNGEDISEDKSVVYASCKDEGANLDEIIKKINAEEESSEEKMRPRHLKKAPVLKGIQPMVVDDNISINFECDTKARKISVTGMTSLKKGYPLGGDYGEDVVIMSISFEDDTEKEYVLKNGVDVTTALGVNYSSRINAVAENSRHIATFGYDKNFEVYNLNVLNVDISSSQKIKKVSFKSCNNGYALLVYSVALKN